MRLGYVVVAVLVTLCACVDGATAPNPSTFDSKLRHLRVESTVNVDDEERALPAGLTKLTDKLKPVSEKLKPLANKLTPVAAKLTDKSMAIAVRLKPIADTFSGKLKPIADKLIPILKPIAAKLNTVPFVKQVVAKLEAFAKKVKNTKVGEATVGERDTMAKFELWFKQNKSPDDVKAMLKVGTGTTVNTKDYDLWNQYSVFYKISQREKEAKVKVA